MDMNANTGAQEGGVESTAEAEAETETHQHIPGEVADDRDDSACSHVHVPAPNPASDYKGLRISIGAVGSEGGGAGSSDNSPRPVTSSSPRNPASGPGSGKGIDVHPYSRGSVIEVLHVPGGETDNGASPALNADDYNALDGYQEYSTDAIFPARLEVDDDSISDWFASDEESKGNDEKHGVNEHNDKEANLENVYLADIVDRLPLHPHLENSHASQEFKYYIHYRGFNRRMDEWIAPNRIVSPPSVGNAKARAQRREEGRRRRDEEGRKERERILNMPTSTGGGSGGVARSRSSELDGSASTGQDSVEPGAIPRKRLRRSVSAAVDDGDPPGGDAAVPTGEAEETVRPTRGRRRGSGAEGAAGAVPPSAAASSSGAEAEELAAPDVVTTVAARTLDEHEGMDAAALKEHEEVTKIKNVMSVELGRHRMDTWYFSPLPRELFLGTERKGGVGGGANSGTQVIDILYVDEFSLNFFARKEELRRYQRKTLGHKGGGRRYPPGNEIYRCGNLSMFEVDGFEERLYCQNLCYIAKLFLDHKTLYFDVDPFLFYVLCEVDSRGFHPVGYFSKEKYSDVGYNLACILTFPSHQRKGYGRFLIAFSYELSKKEEKVGSPEKPMSDLGQQAYIPYWTSTMVDFLLNRSGECRSMSIMDISKKTSILAMDIIFALNTLGILKFVNGVYFIHADRKELQLLAKKHPVKDPRVDPSKLHWTPYINDVKRDKFSISSKKPSIEANTSNPC